MRMVSSNLSTGKELAKIRDEYKTAVEKFETYGTPISQTLPEERLISMQSMLYSILIAVENPTSKKNKAQSKEAIHLFNMISAELKNLQFDRRAVNFH